MTTAVGRLKKRPQFLKIAAKGQKCAMPGLVLQACNNIFREHFLLPAWIHVKSDITYRKPLRVGQHIQVRAVPFEKYEKKGHQLVTFYCVLEAEGQVALECLHNAIFQVRAAAA